MKQVNLLKSFIVIGSCLISSISFASIQQQSTAPTSLVQTSAIGAHIIKDAKGRVQIELQLDSPAEVKVLKDKQILAIEQAPAGISFMNTDNFPTGNYEIILIIKKEDGVFYLTQNISIP